MTDITQRLRSRHWQHQGDFAHWSLRDEAADEIDAQRELLRLCRAERDELAGEVYRLRLVIAEWDKLRDPTTLHHNLLRDFPARLSRDALLHLAGDDAVARAALGE